METEGSALGSPVVKTSPSNAGALDPQLGG